MVYAMLCYTGLNDIDPQLHKQTPVEFCSIFVERIIVLKLSATWV